MALIDIFSISKQYDNKKLLENVDFHLHEGERTAIIGQNGCGKSTFMNIVYGKLDADTGKRVVNNNVEIEMLSQVPKFAHGLSVKQAIENELVNLTKAKQRYDELTHLLADDFENKSYIAEHDICSKFLDHHSAWNLDNKIDQVLHTFKLKEYENKSIHELSGGEQRRVALASLILKKPDVLILDEPTNHLDVHMVEFLEDIILKENFTILFVSHDRYFIDKIATQIVEIEHFALRKYKGGYADFLIQKEAYLETVEKQQHDLEKHLKFEMAWLTRGVKARTKRNMGRVRRVHDLKDQVSQNTPGAIRKMRSELMREKASFAIPNKTNSKKIFFDIYNICYSVGDKLLINKFKAKILQKDRIAIVGNNGCGKSTLLKLLTNQLQVDSGTIKASEFNIGYFDQQRKELNDDNDLLTTFCPNGGDRVEIQGKNMHVYGYLKSFNFPPEDLSKRIGMLSGGERSRVALALLFTKKVDCLILDEPTNDLDIQTINILEEKLNQFEGVVVFVSHDRYFVDKVAQKLFIFTGDGKIEESYQSYTDYLDLEKTLKELDEMERNASKSGKDISSSNQVSDINNDYTSIKKTNKLSFKDKHALEKLPNEITELEIKINSISQQISQHADNADKLNELITEITPLQLSLEQKEEKYLELLELEETITI